jgi:agmatine deiminase
MAHVLGVPAFRADMILEGGSIDVNGRGLLLTTESCLLHPNRNPRLKRHDVESYLGAYLGVDHVIWLKEGIAGDDTDGHVDDLARFIGTKRVITAVENDTASENYPILQENLDLLKSVVLPDGSVLDVLPLPMPSQRRIHGEIMPASYANFFVGNRTVLVPTYQDANDAEALAIVQRAFPGRRVTGLYCGDLIWGLGAFHCLTQQVPAPTGTTAVKSKSTL